MRNQSKTENFAGEGVVAPIDVRPDFPVAAADFNTRGEHPLVKPHIHNLCEIGYCFDGAGVFLVANKVLTFKAGDAVFITSREFHQARGNPGQETTWGFLNFDPAGLVPASPENPSVGRILECCSGENFSNIIDGTEYPEIASCIRRIVTERRDMSANWQPMIRALVWELILHLSRLCPENAGSDTEGNFDDVVRIAPALKYMNAHFPEKITLGDLAGVCHTSIPNFRKLFYKAMGTAPYPYLTKLRIKYASSMLENLNEPIYQIAYLAGFNELSNFNRQFQAIHGISPSQYRKKTLKQHRSADHDH